MESYEKLKTKKEVNDYFFNLYKKDNIPEEVLKYWHLNKRKTSQHQWQLFPKNEYPIEEVNEVIERYDWPQSIKLKPENMDDYREDSHITWKQQQVIEAYNGDKVQLNWHRYKGPARIQIKNWSRFNGGHEQLHFRIRWYLNNHELRENDMLELKLERLGL